MHDSIAQRGGAERVLLALIKSFPNADIMTSVYKPSKTFPEFKNMKIQEILPKIFRNIPLPFLIVLMPYLFRIRKYCNYDVIIASSTIAAHNASYRHKYVIVYMHNTPRWLYQIQDFEKNLNCFFKYFARIIRKLSIKADYQAASKVAYFFTNSVVTKRRVEEHYNRLGEVLYPPISLDKFEKYFPSNSGQKYLLNISRPRAYKNVETVVEVALMLNERLVLIGADTKYENYGKSGQICVFTEVSDEDLVTFYSKAKLLLCAAHEDLGLTPIEANYFGVPVVAPAAGGYLETVIDRKTGILAKSESIPDLSEAVKLALNQSFNYIDFQDNFSKFNFENFSERIRQQVNNVQGLKGK